jgi:hypothetical protein
VVENAIVPKLTGIPPQHGVDYLAFVDMSGGSNDDATLGIAHWDGQKAILDLLINQDTPTPFNPRLAVKTFADACKRYRCREVHGDAYAGQTFRMDFSDLGVDYVVEKQSRTDLYENLEVALNAGQVQLLDLAKLRSEMMTVIRRGASLDHMPGRHDDWATSAAGALTLVNPVLGQETPAFLTFMERQLDAAKEGSAVPPTVAQAHAGHPLMQIGVRRSPDDIRLIVPDGSSHVYGIGGVAYLVTTEGDLSVAYVSLDDAKAFLSPRNFAMREANAELAERIAGKSAVVSRWMPYAPQGGGHNDEWRNDRAFQIARRTQRRPRGYGRKVQGSRRRSRPRDRGASGLIPDADQECKDGATAPESARRIQGKMCRDSRQTSCH